jgi:hypothetical protein
MLNPLRRRRGVPLELFYAYWRDAHVQIAARLPGINDLRIHQVSFETAGPWPRIPGVDHELPEEDRFEGVPEPDFRTDEDFGRFLANMGPLMDDEVNLFEETIGYQSLGASTVTHVDRLAPAAPDGDPDLVRYLVFVKAAVDVTTDAFGTFVGERLAADLSSDPRVLKLRTHLFEPYSNTAVALDAAAVSHYKAPDKQYQAAYEIAFGDPLELARFVHGPAWAGSIDGQVKHFRAAHPFRILRSYQMKEGGELTLAGLRTPAVAEQIVRLGALNQLEPDVAHLVRTGSLPEG